jgi:predicted nucleic acid-binding protein
VILTPTDAERLVVPDASAIVELLIDPGEAGEAAGRALAGARLIAPHLLPFEVANVLRRRRNAGLLSDADAVTALRLFGDLPIELWPWEALAAHAMAHGHNLSSYDASYVAVAEITGAVLVTADRRLAGAPDIGCAVEVV